MSPTKPTTLFVDPADDLSEVIFNIRESQSSDITLLVPHRALLVQSPINLHVLKLAADESEKQIRISTSDPLALYLSGIAGIPTEQEVVAPSSTDSEETIISHTEPATDADEDPEDWEESELASDPSPVLPRSINPLSGFKLKSLSFDQSSSEDAKPDKFPIMSGGMPKFKLPQFNFQRPSWKLERHHKIAIGFGAVGLGLLILVGIFVLPKGYVALEVPSEAYKKQFTLTLADEQDLQAAGPNILAGRFIEITREHVATFQGTGEENKGNPASGQINVVNYTGSIQGILANTRFVTSNGLVYRIKNEILVPPAVGNRPGRAVVEAISEAGGTKYNISSPNQMTIPNISEGLKPLLYGEVVGSFTGGTDNVVKVVSQEDIDRGKEEAAKNVFVATETDLKKLVKRTEEFNSAFIQNDIIDAVPSVTPGAEQDNFEVRVQSRSWTIVTPKKSFPEALVSAASFEVEGDKRVTDRTLAGAKIDPLESNFITHRISLLVSLEGRVGPRINQSEIVQNIKNRPLAEAQQYLQKLTNISSSSVELWPSFVSRLPFLANRIHLQVIYLGE